MSDIAAVGKLAVTTENVKKVIADITDVSLIGKDGILGQMLVIMDDNNEPIVFAPIQEVSSRSVTGVYGANGFYGTVSMHQASPFDSVVIDVDLSAPAQLHDWNLVSAPAIESTSDPISRSSPSACPLRPALQQGCDYRRVAFAVTSTAMHP